MDRPERPEQPSIFSRPDPDLVDDWTTPRLAEHAVSRDPEPAEAPAPFEPTRPARDPLYPARAPGGGRSGAPGGGRSGPPRGLVLVAGGGGLIALLAVGFIVMNVMGGDPTTASTSPTPSSSATPAESAPPSASPSPSGTPIPTPPPAPEALVQGEWATILADSATLHASASGSAAAAGTANRGEIVMIDDTPPVEADGQTWYHAIVSPGVAGWIAGHDETENFALSDGQTTSVRWCAVPESGTYEVTEPTYQGPGSATVLETAHVGGLPVPTSLLGPAGSGIVELAWGTQDQVCLDLAITDGRTSAIGISSTIEACGSPRYGSAMMILFGTGAVGSDGQADSRLTVLDPTVIGFDYTTAGEAPNLMDVFNLAQGYGGQGICVTGSASGAATSPSLAFSAATSACAWVSSRTSSAVTLSYPDSDGTWVQLRLTAGSFVGEGVTAQSRSYDAEKGFRVSAERGVDGSVGISVRAVEGCGD